MSFSKLYGGLPISLQHVACSLEGLRINRRRYGPRFQSALARAETRVVWRDGEIGAYRDTRLAEFIRFCAENVAYYRAIFNDLGIDATEISSLAGLQQLPVLRKEDVQRGTGLFLGEGIKKRNTVAAHTSGTTGAGLRFLITREAEREQWAVWWRYRRWHGIPFNAWCGYFGGRSVVPLNQEGPPYWRYNYPGRQIFFSAYHASPARCGAYFDELRRSRPLWLHGYPSMLALFGEWLIEKGGDLGYQVRWITTGAENLLAGQKEVIERAFGVRPRQHYGMAEGVANFSECELGRLHVDEDFAAVEFLPAGEEGRYRVVGTNFTNRAFALVRYDVGDVIELEDGECTCGRPGRLVRAIDGRQEDYVVLKSGALVGRMDHVFKDMTNVREAQVRQSVPGKARVLVVKGPGYGNEDENRLRSEFKARVGELLEIGVEYVPALERTKTGKLRFVVREG